MAATDIKALEKLVKEILDKVKNLGENKNSPVNDETLDKINEKLDTIDERLSAPNSSDTVSAEIVSKVDAINSKLEEKSEDYIKEIQLAFEGYFQKSASLINAEDTDNLNLKDFISIITNEMIEVKNQFEKFNEEFTDINLNTSMGLSKEVVSLKNYVLALSDATDKIKEKLENYAPDSANLTNDISEVFNANLASFKNDVFSVLAKITDGIKKFNKSLKSFEGLELSVGEIIENQHKNKDDIIKIIQNNIEEENKKLIPQIIQITDSISFDEQAEDIKDGLYAINENIGVVNKNIATSAMANREVLNQITDISCATTEVSEIVKSDLAKKLSKIGEALDTVSNEFTVLTKGSKEDTGDYLYTLLDLESDISKVRVILDDLSHSLKDDRSLAENVTKNIADKITNLNDFIEKTSSSYSSADYKDLLLQFDALNEDISSISKRTNKLILTSDDASEKLQKNITDFQNIMSNISETVKRFEGSSVLKTLNLKIDNIQKILLSVIGANKAINEAFMYLASWIDTTSEDIKEIKADLSQLKENKQESFNNKEFEKIESLINENNRRNDIIEQKLNFVTSRLEELSKTNNDTVESKIEKILYALENVSAKENTDSTINPRLEKIENQLAQLLTFVEEE